MATVLVAAAAAEEMIPVALEIGEELSADALAVQTELAATAKMLTATANRSLKPAIRILGSIRILASTFPLLSV